MKQRTKAETASASMRPHPIEPTTPLTHRRLCHNSHVHTFSQCHSSAFSALLGMDAQP